MAVPAQMVKELREFTGISMIECKNSLEKFNGDFEKAKDYLINVRGVALAAKKEGRLASQGRIGHYIHTNNKIGVMMELNCETDFVASTDVFQDLMRNLCLQVCAMNPQVVKREDLPKESVDQARAEYAADVKGKPPEIAAKILDGKLDKLYFSQRCLLDQVYIKDEKGQLTIKELIKQAIVKVGENITVGRFVRFEVGKQ